MQESANEAFVEVDENSIEVPDQPAANDGVTLSDKAGRVSERLGLFDNRAWLLGAMFDPTYYAQAIDNFDINEAALLDHFLTIGVAENISPNALFDIGYTKRFLEEELEIDTDTAPVIMLWFEHCYDDKITPNDWFDEDYYFAKYADLKGNVDWGFYHYALDGYRCNRFPSDTLAYIIDTYLTIFGATDVRIEDMVNRVPHETWGDFISDDTQFMLRQLFMPELYRKQFPELANHSDNHLYLHFICVGATTDCRPTVFFHESTYRNLIQKYHDDLEANAGLCLDKPAPDSRLEKLAPAAHYLGNSHSYFHWFFVGKLLGIIPTPLFDTAHYTATSPDIVSNWETSPFEHYLERGSLEGYRDACVFFNAAQYDYAANGRKHACAVLDFVLHGQFKNIPPINGMAIEHFSSDDPYRDSSVERAAEFFKAKVARLESGELAEMTAKLNRLEPQLPRPYGVKNIRYAPLFHPEVRLVKASAPIQQLLPKTHYKSVVLMPHCRMAGSAKIAGRFVKALTKLTNLEDVLVITTDLSVFERPEWFPEGVDVFDLSAHLGSLNSEPKARILLDVVRGLRPTRLININSNLGWHMTQAFSRQLSEWMDLYFYLFCWDLDKNGNKAGYPIQWFLPTFDSAKGVFTDSDVLTKELHERYCHTDQQRNKIKTLHTPAEDRDINYLPMLRNRENHQGKRRVFWSGRFDRQKRVDILCAVANLVPDVEFWVWGKPVLADSDMDIEAAAPNIKCMGHYTSIDDVPIASCDCFLYTAGWDGLPTVLIEVGSRGVPVVASAAGGVVDLVNSNTGWPIEDIDNPVLYAEAIQQIVGNYSEALNRAEKLRTHTLKLCSDKKYDNIVNSMIARAASK